MVPNAGARIINSSTFSGSSPFPPPQNHFPPPHFHSAIQIPMLGSNLQPNKGLQNPQQGPQQQQGPNPSEIPLPPQSGQDFTLSSVLHFLQTEWRRYERDRNEWEIERAEMRARIALLEGEKRSFDNVKLDLMRRIKMLEYALRVERSKQLTQPSSQSVPPAKLATIQSQGGGGSQKEDALSHREESSGSSPHSEDVPLPHVGPAANGSGQASKQQTWSTTWSATSGPNAATAATLGKPPLGRDPKSRARSRDYLKQCLQEISYLTSPQAMNPLPNRPLLSNSSLPVALPNVPSFDQIAFNGRPTKRLQDVSKDFPSINGMSMLVNPTPSGAPSQPERPPSVVSATSTLQLQQQPQAAPAALTQPSHPSQQQQQLPQPQPQHAQLPLPPDSAAQIEPKNKEDRGDSQRLTAIFRPDDDFKEKLRQTHEATDKARLEGSELISGAASWERRERDEDEDVKDEEPADMEDEEGAEGEEGEGTKMWKAKRTLRNHLDAVRAIAFHPTELCLATGGDDNTVKIWRVDVSGLASSAARPTTDVEPQLTLRGHSAAITRLVHAPWKGLLYSASMDSSIRIWALPAPTHTTYAPYDATRARGELIGHTDAVWDLTLVRDESTLISCGAEGAVKVWDVSGPSGGGSLKLSWFYDGLDADNDRESDSTEHPGASAVEAIKTDLKKVAVAFRGAAIKIFDIETGKEVITLSTDAGDASNQVNSIVSHPTVPLLITGHEDKHIRIFDIITGQCTYSMAVHEDAVTSLSIDPSGFSLVSGSHDCRVRFWDILGSKACVQDIPHHREKAHEGVLAVEFHPSLPIMASAGADGVVKLYATS